MGMADDLDTGALLARTYELPNRQRVRLRLARRSDLPALQALLAQRGIQPSALELERLVRYDPRRRLVVCATTPLYGTEAILGVGAIELDGEVGEPDTIVVDERITAGLPELLAGALVGLAARRVA
jgi:N-acetylglutamate synthase-like GNAT family acetyltransferase